MNCWRARVKLPDKDAGDLFWKLEQPARLGLAWGGDARAGISMFGHSAAYLGEQFDIHAGDLIFPHHENESPSHVVPMILMKWRASGCITAMSPSMVRKCPNHWVISPLLLMCLLICQVKRCVWRCFQRIIGRRWISHRQWLAKSALDSLYRAAGDAEAADIDADFLAVLGDDLNTPNAIARLHELARDANKGDPVAAGKLKLLRQCSAA